MHQGIGRLTLVALPLWLAACASWPQTLYHWGNYPDTIHAWYDGTDDWAGQEQALRKIMASWAWCCPARGGMMRQRPSSPRSRRCIRNPPPS